MLFSSKKKARRSPIYEQVMDNIGKPIVYNICCLGALVDATQLLEPETILDVLDE